MRSIRIVRHVFATAALFFVLAHTHAQPGVPLRLGKTIQLPGVKGRIDHMAFDPQRQLLFVAALGNDTVEIVDIATGKVAHTLSGLAEPQGVLYQPEKNRLWVANARDGTVRIFDAHTWQQLRSIPLGDDADNIRRDPATGHIFIGYGSGAIAVFDAEAARIANIKLDAHPESFQLEKNGPRIFVNLPDSNKIAVIDRARASIIATWSTAGAHGNFPMALDEAHARLFIVCRNPATLLVLDTKSGNLITKLPAVADSDDVFYDSARQRIYASGGEGAITVVQQQPADHYTTVARIETTRGARTSLFSAESGSLFLAVRQQGSNPAAIDVFRTQP